MPLLADGSIDPDAEATVWSGVTSMTMRTRRRHENPATRRRVRPVGERPLPLTFGPFEFEWTGTLRLLDLSADFLYLLGLARAPKTATRRDPWLIRLGQRLCGVR